jgi:formamidopyrimidine-DNA glycosylase
MPELPDVEGFRRLLAATAAGQRVRGVTVTAPDILRNTSPARLARSLSGCRLGQPRRHGKWLCAPAGPRTLVLHFGMDGALAWVGSRDLPRYPLAPHDRLILHCENGDLRYHSMRKLGGVWLAADAGEVAAVTGPLGPDALGLDLDGLAGRLSGRRGAVKPALMDQSVVAGLGNLTVDEILWRARVHPHTPVASLSRQRLRDLHRALREVLADTVAQGRVPGGEGWLTGARGDKAAACPRCGTRLARARSGGRTTVWCPRCQPAL